MLLQYYLWRWGIEVNFREEKALIGIGEVQVRPVQPAAPRRHRGSLRSPVGRGFAVYL
jgi:hypothetical protein